MISARKHQNIYCFDTSAFIDLSRTHERIIEFPLLWNHLEKMMYGGQIISHRLVFDELSSHAKNPDFITKWVAGKKQFFLEKTNEQIRLVSDIIQKFPNLIDYQMEHEQADPWLIALAIEKSKKQTLFFINISIVVSQENPKSSKKIPVVCKYFGVQHASLKEFLDNNLKINIQLSRK